MFILFTFINLVICFVTNSNSIDLIVNDVTTKNCPPGCPKIMLPVCGFDGKSYKIFNNNCLLTKENCQHGKEWTIVNTENCDKNENMLSSSGNQSINCKMDCPKVPLQPICAFNRNQVKLFLNECEFIQANCQANVNEKWIPSPLAHCNEEFNSFDDKCAKPCPYNYFPVCGFDGEKSIVFVNECTYEVANCYENEKWEKIPLEDCSTTKTK